MINKGCADTYLKSLHNQLSAVFNYAVRYCGLPSNPARECGAMGSKNADRLFPYTKYFLNHEMQRGCKLSGIKKIRVHDLRHSHASLLIHMDVPVLLISERLGHKNVETTLQTYAHLYPSRLNDTMLELQKLHDNAVNSSQNNL